VISPRGSIAEADAALSMGGPARRGILALGQLDQGDIDSHTHGEASGIYRRPKRGGIGAP
jgi:hypothetical protein